MELKNFEIYTIARHISSNSWKIYQTLSWQDHKIFGDQFISAIDSIAANIAEGFGRYYYLDKNRFYYNARGSLFESIHWLELLRERGKINEENYQILSQLLILLNKKINSHILSTKNQAK